MKLLLVSATIHEIAPLCKDLGIPDAQVASGAYGEVLEGLEVGVLVTGVGMVNTAYRLGSRLGTQRPDMALQVGIGGGWEGGPALGEVVEVVAECYPELGADSPDGPLDLHAMGFAHFEAGGKAYYNEIAQPRPGLGGMRHCKAVTVNRVSGEAVAIAALQARWQPEVESMEGAAFFQACLLADVPFRQLRAISNMVEPRNRAGWKVAEAIAALCSTTAVLLRRTASDPTTL
jgi:futalosine hydrolase